MKPNWENSNYPVFEDNQVLSSANLNQIFNYLDEQGRLTRANLIGIGIVCGLEVTWYEEDATIRLSKGCGVTSEGYLIVETDNVELESYREEGYTIPDNPEYQQFTYTDDENKTVQYPLWELFPEGEPETTLLSSPENFLNDKALVLFYELKKEGLRNCSSNDCNDKGSRKIATVRHLLIKKSDAESVIAKANNLSAESTRVDLEEKLLAKFNLPELRLPRYAVPDTGLAASAEVLTAFQAVFKEHKLVSKTQKALYFAYEAFEPLLKDLYPDNPFSDSSEFLDKFYFLENKGLENGEQVLFLQYYYEFFDNLLQAYNEFCQKGLTLQSACCLDEKLFPQHLMAGLFTSEEVVEHGIYRHQFMPSPATGGGAERKKELQLLFQRIEQMISQFSNTPNLPEYYTEIRTDEQIRITPSKLGDVPLSDKAIPYYLDQFDQNIAPSMYQLWNAEKTQLNRANHNLGYWSPQYHPPAPSFVTGSLNYDLEPYNFLRIEGHLAKNYQNVLRTLLSLKNTYRLPIDFVAIPSGEALSAFLEKNPGIQHKAGVPIGGTFIVVYHKSAEFSPPWRLMGSPIRDLIFLDDSVGIEDNEFTVANAVRTIREIPSYVPEERRHEFIEMPVSSPPRKPQEIRDALVNKLETLKLVEGVSKEDIIKVVGGMIGFRPLPEREGIIAKTLDDLSDGTVIADFFLPYLCSDETLKLRLKVTVGCTKRKEKATAEVTLEPQGGEPPFTYTLKDNSGRDFSSSIAGNKVNLAPGRYNISIRDNIGLTFERQIKVPEPLIIRESEDDNIFLTIIQPEHIATLEVSLNEVERLAPTPTPTPTHTVKFKITGGTPPYRLSDDCDAGKINGNIFISTPKPVKEKITVGIIDNKGCASNKEIHN